MNQYYSNTEDKLNSNIYELKVIKINKDWLEERNLYESKLKEVGADLIINSVNDLINMNQKFFQHLG